MAENSTKNKENRRKRLLFIRGIAINRPSNVFKFEPI